MIKESCHQASTSPTMQKYITKSVLYEGCMTNYLAAQQIDDN